MTDAQLLLGLLGFALGALQALAIWLLGVIWRELRELRTRVDAIELDLYQRAPSRVRAGT